VQIGEDVSASRFTSFALVAPQNTLTARPRQEQDDGEGQCAVILVPQRFSTVSHSAAHIPVARLTSDVRKKTSGPVA
jgi:hypothetical protein